MTARESQGVSGILRRNRGQPKEALHHKGYLFFFRTTMSDHGSLDPRRFVLYHLSAPASQGRQQGSPALRQRQRRAGIMGGEGRLHRHDSRGKAFQYRGQTISKGGQLRRPGRRAGRPDAPELYRFHPLPGAGHQAPPGHPGPGIQTQNPLRFIRRRECLRRCQSSPRRSARRRDLRRRSSAAPFEQLACPPPAPGYPVPCRSWPPRR